jgi:hypothetical protein
MGKTKLADTRIDMPEHAAGIDCPENAFALQSHKRLEKLRGHRRLADVIDQRCHRNPC